MMKSEFHAESQYIYLINQILSEGQERSDRTGTGTISIFAPSQLRFNVTNQLPLLTTKTVPLRLVFEELMWFIKGQTDACILADKKVHIWDGNMSREFLDSRGLVNNRVGDLGPVYGFQWRHFGAQYRGVEGDLDSSGKIISYANQGTDQLYNVIKSIRDNPTDRRIILSAWNPSGKLSLTIDLVNMALPPCHLLCQFYVHVASESARPILSCQLYQRSADVGLGVPFNIASYSLFLYLLARVTGCEAGEFIHVLGDAHIYSNHVQVLKQQCEREPRAFPRLEIIKQDPFFGDWRARRASASVEDMLAELESFEWEDLKLVGYEPHGKLSMKMAI